MERLFAFLAALAATTVTLSGTSSAAYFEAARVGPFDAVSSKGGADVIVRPGTSHTVRVVRGDPRAVEILSKRPRSLEIRCRPDACRGSAPRVEVTSPRVTALAVSGGGRIYVERGFAPQEDVALAVHGGGQLDASHLPAADVAAAINGGGDILTHAGSDLAASVRGGGTIRYLGNPSVATAIQGGGEVRMASGTRH